MYYYYARGPVLGRSSIMDRIVAVNERDKQPAYQMVSDLQSLVSKYCNFVNFIIFFLVTFNFEGQILGRNPDKSFPPCYSQSETGNLLRISSNSCNLLRISSNSHNLFGISRVKLLYTLSAQCSPFPSSFSKIPFSSSFILLPHY